MKSDAQPTTTDFSECCRCGQQAHFLVACVSVLDGDLLGDAVYCWQHAMELVEGQTGLPVMLKPCHVATTRDECYRHKCDCLPAKLDRCARCTRLADVWMTAGTLEVLDDLERGVLLCGPDGLAALKDGTLPVEVREELREALNREEKDPCPF
jgi:hypothetical protein